MESTDVPMESPDDPSLPESKNLKNFQRLPRQMDLLNDSTEYGQWSMNMVSLLYEHNVLSYVITRGTAHDNTIIPTISEEQTPTTSELRSRYIIAAFAQLSKIPEWKLLPADRRLLVLLLNVERRSQVDTRAAHDTTAAAYASCAAAYNDLQIIVNEFTSGSEDTKAGDTSSVAPLPSNDDIEAAKKAVLDGQALGIQLANAYHTTEFPSRQKNAVVAILLRSLSPTFLRACLSQDPEYGFDDVTAYKRLVEDPVYVWATIIKVCKAMDKEKKLKRAAQAQAKLNSEKHGMALKETHRPTMDINKAANVQVSKVKNPGSENKAPKQAAMKDYYGVPFLSLGGLGDSMYADKKPSEANPLQTTSSMKAGRQAQASKAIASNEGGSSRSTQQQPSPSKLQLHNKPAPAATGWGNAEALREAREFLSAVSSSQNSNKKGKKSGRNATFEEPSQQMQISRTERVSYNGTASEQERVGWPRGPRTSIEAASYRLTPPPESSKWKPPSSTGTTSHAGSAQNNAAPRARVLPSGLHNKVTEVAQNTQISNKCEHDNDGYGIDGLATKVKVEPTEMQTSTKAAADGNLWKANWAMSPSLEKGFEDLEGLSWT